MTYCLDAIARGTIPVVDDVAEPNANFTMKIPEDAPGCQPCWENNLVDIARFEVLVFMSDTELPLSIDTKGIDLPMQNVEVLTAYTDRQTQKGDIAFATQTGLEVTIGEKEILYERSTTNL